MRRYQKGRKLRRDCGVDLGAQCHHPRLLRSNTADRIAGLGDGYGVSCIKNVNICTYCRDFRTEYGHGELYGLKMTGKEKNKCVLMG